MLRRIFNHLNESVSGGALFIAFFSIVSKVLGLFRDRLLAVNFGAERLTDIYFASFKLPDLIFNILVLGALTSSFIPVFQKVWGKDPREGIALSNSVLNLLLLVVISLSVVIFFSANIIVPFVVPGFSGAEKQLVVSMTRIVLISLIFFTASNVLSGVLNSWRKFFTFALSSVVYNMGIIIGIVLLYPLFGFIGLAIGVVLGSVLHFSVQLIEALRHGWFYQLSFRIDAPLRRIFSLMVPRTIGLAANQISSFVITILASTLSAGSLAIYNFSSNLQSFPVTIFGISLAVAAFPSFSKTLAENNTSGFKDMFSLQLRRILYFLIPLSFTILMLRAHIVRVVLGAGAFDWEDTRLTANALGFFALSLSAQGLTPLLTRSFYALEDTLTPVIISFMGVGITIILSLAFFRTYGVLGLVFADVVGSVAYLVTLFAVLHHRLGDLRDSELLISIRRITIISLLAAALIYLSLQITAQLMETSTFAGIFAQGAVSGAIGIATYIAISMMMGFDEITIVKRYLLKFLKPLLNGSDK